MISGSRETLPLASSPSILGSVCLFVSSTFFENKRRCSFQVYYYCALWRVRKMKKNNNIKNTKPNNMKQDQELKRDKTHEKHDVKTDNVRNERRDSSLSWLFRHRKEQNEGNSLTQRLTDSVTKLSGVLLCISPSVASSWCLLPSLLTIEKWRK